jgi:S-methylmethionine-dependent homocysteine/selenocysteine methylase
VAHLLAEGVTLLGGACGTEIQRRGVPTPLPLWSAAALDSHPDVVREVHADQVRAGARLVTANTFRTDRRTLTKGGAGARARDEARRLTKLAVRLAREGVGRAAPTKGVLIAGSIAPLEDCYRPDLVPDDTTLRVEHAVKVGNLVAAGAPVALVETMNTIREAVAALGACQAGNLPAFVSFVCDAEGRLLSGEDPAEAARAVAPFAPLGLLVNCCPPDAALRALERLRPATSLPLGAYPNGGGQPDSRQGWVWKGGLGRWRWLRAMDRLLDFGVALLGGCCGTTPAHTAALARRIAARI